MPDFLGHLLNRPDDIVCSAKDGSENGSKESSVYGRRWQMNSADTPANHST
jgi:hypothetical protein